MRNNMAGRAVSRIVRTKLDRKRIKNGQGYRDIEIRREGSGSECVEKEG
jgi:hypothetical protein